jgi:hypothetical protein
MGKAAQSPRNRRQSKKVVPRPVEHAGTPIENIDDLRAFIRWAQGDPHLSAWEENFLNSAKKRLRWDLVLFSPKAERKLAEIRAKLHYDQQHIPLPPIDPDGLVENDDPDGWPIENSQLDEFKGVEDPDELLAAFGQDF